LPDVISEPCGLIAVGSESRVEEDVVAGPPTALVGGSHYGSCWSPTPAAEVLGFTGNYGDTCSLAV